MGINNTLFGWQRYLFIEEQFVYARKYVSLDQEGIYSEFFTRSVIILGAEIEGGFKKLCENITGLKYGNIGQYKDVILHRFPRLEDFYSEVRDTSQEIYPYKGWDKGHLEWWDVYTNIKHSLVDEAATSGIAMKMLAAYQLLLVLVSITEDRIIDEGEDYIRAFSAVDAPKLLVPALSFASGQDNDGMLNSLFSVEELESRLQCTDT